MENGVNFISCSRCGLINSPADSVCRRCGWSLGADAPASTVYSSPPPTYYGAPTKSSKGPVWVLVLVVMIAGVAVAGAVGYSYIRPFVLESEVSWHKETPPGGRFTVSLPGPMKTEQKPMNTAVGPITAYIYGSEVRGQGVVAVTVADYPIGNDVAVDAGLVLDEAAKGMAQKTNSTIAAKRDLTLPDGWRGVEVDIDPGKGKDVEVVKARIYWVRTRLYVLLIAGNSDSKLWRERDIFLTSLELLK